VRYEAESDASKTPAGDGIQTVGLKSYLLPIFFGALPEDAVIVRGTGGFKLQGRLVPLVVEPVKGFFIFPGIDFRVNNVFSSSSGNQQEDVVGNGTQVHGQFLNGGNLVEIRFCDGCVDLEFDTGLFCHGDSLKGAVKSAVHSPEMVMDIPGGSVQADADSLNAGIRHLPGFVFGDECAVGGHHHTKSLIGTIPGDFENILSQQGLATGQNNDRLSHHVYLVQKIQTGGGI